MCYWTSQGRQTLTEDKIQCRHSIGVHDHKHLTSLLTESKNINSKRFRAIYDGAGESYLHLINHRYDNRR